MRERSAVRFESAEGRLRLDGILSLGRGGGRDGSHPRPHGAATQLDAEIDAVVDDLLLGGPEAIAATKELLWRVPDMDEAAAFEWTRALSSELFAGEEAAAGFRAFLDKRPPPWAPGA